MNYLIEGKDKYICRYPESDLVQILKVSEYHSDEWEETDQEEINPEEIGEEDAVEETIKEKITSLYVYEKWWRSPAVCTVYL